MYLYIAAVCMGRGAAPQRDTLKNTIQTVSLYTNYCLSVSYFTTQDTGSERPQCKRQELSHLKRNIRTPDSRPSATQQHGMTNHISTVAALVEKAENSHCEWVGIIVLMCFDSPCVSSIRQASSCNVIQWKIIKLPF